MSANIEIKARLENPEETFLKISSIGYRFFSTIKQEDIYYHCKEGRLKLRIENEQKGELIYYRRPDLLYPKLSRYERINIQDFTLAEKIFSQAFGVLGRIIKKRRIYFTCQTRIHLDTVESLGDFIELETVLEENQNEEDGVIICRDIMEKLGIPEKKLIAGSYIDLLLNIQHGRKSPY